MNLIIYLRRYAIFVILICATKRSLQTDQVPLKCDEFDRSPDYKDIYCTVTNLKVTHSQQVKIADYTSYQTNNIKFMKFYDSAILYIPHKLFEIFPNLKNLDVSYSEVIDIPRNTFTGAEALSYLNVSHNNVTEITTSVFIGATQLLRIDLSYNKITKLNEHAFKGLTILDRLSLSNNKIKYLEKTIFTDNVYLESIALDNNEIELIEPEIFLKLQRLRDVDLTNNKLLKIESNTFEPSYNLDSLYVSGNKLKEFHLDQKNPMSLLQLDNNQLKLLIINGTKYVRADNNSITKIIAYSPSTLEKLSLANNNISDIGSIKEFTNLISLDLSHNNIGLINITTFDKLKRLKSLILRHTNIRGINFGTFSKQTNLEILDLSYNNLGTINLDIFVPYLSKLQELYLDGNNLTELRSKMAFSYAFPALSMIGLSNNNFNCSYLHRILNPPYLSTFVKLHIEKIEQFENMTHIRGIPCRSDEYNPTPSIVDNQNSSIQQDSTNNGGKTTIQESLQMSIDRLKIHEKQLEQHLLLMKIFVIIVCVIIGYFVIYNILKFSSGKNNSIVRNIYYRSTSTMDTVRTTVD